MALIHPPEHENICDARTQTGQRKPVCVVEQQFAGLWQKRMHNNRSFQVAFAFSFPEAHS